MTPLELSETGNIGRRTREIMVGTKACPALKMYGISLTGVSHADDEFCFIRRRPRLTQILVSSEGAGEVSVDGEWQRCEPGSAYITPPIVPHAYRSLPPGSEHGVDWIVCWVMYSSDFDDGPDERRPMPDFGFDTPTLVEADGTGLRHAIENLHRESMGLAEPAVMQSWASLVHSYARRVAAPPSRMESIWKIVGADLANDWSLADLADLAGVTPEQVRRICRREVGSSPMQHVTELRMRAAASLLACEFYTVESVAERVGYENPFAFSTAFKRWMGMTPSEFRRHAPAER